MKHQSQSKRKKRHLLLQRWRKAVVPLKQKSIFADGRIMTQKQTPRKEKKDAETKTNKQKDLEGEIEDG